MIGNTNLNKKKRSSKLAIFIFDSIHWYGIVFERTNVFFMTSKQEGVQDTLPEDLTQWALQHKAKVLRVVIPAEIHNIELELPETLNFEETQTAIIWETAAMTGKNAHEIRNASLKLDILGFSLYGSQILTTTFKLDIIKKFAAHAEHFGMHFDGIISLQNVIMAFHYGEKKELEIPLIILMKNSLFVFLPPGEQNKKPVIKNISLDFFPESSGKLEHNIYFQRKLSQRLKLSGGKVSLFEAKGINENLKDIIIHHISPDKLHSIKIDKIFPSLSDIIKNAVSDDINVPCPMAVLQSGYKLKFEKADTIFLILILLATTYILFSALILWTNNVYGSIYLKKHKKLYRQIENLRKSNTELKIKLNNTKSLAYRQKKYIGIDKYFMDFMIFIATYTGENIRMDAIIFSKDTITIKGIISSQNALSLFTNKMFEYMGIYGIEIISSSLKKEISEGYTTFVLKVRRTR